MTKAYNAPAANTAKAFNRAYANHTPPPWDTAGPAQFVHELVYAGEIHGDVLDAGCGTGENAIYLASLGHRVLAFDAAPAALEKARTKARERGVDVSFELADARALPAWDGRFATIIDSGLFHVMDKAGDRRRYADALGRVAAPDAMLHLLAFAGNGPGWLSRVRTRLRRSFTGFGTHGVTPQELRTAFASGWRIESIDQRSYGWGTFLLARIRRAAIIQRSR